MNSAEQTNSKNDLLNLRRVHVLRFGAVALVGFGLAEAAWRGEALWPMLVRLGWAATALVVAQCLKAAAHQVRAWSLLALGALSPVFFAALLHFRGADGGIGFASFVAAPVVFAVLLRGEVEVAVSVAASSLISGVALLLLHGVEGNTIGEWALALLASGAMAVYAARIHRSMMSAERSLNEQRLEAVNLATRNEVERMRAERAALLAHLTMGCAHEINNPLTVIALHLSLIERSMHTLEPQMRPKDVVDSLKQIAQSSEQIASVIRGLTAVAPLGQEPSYCDVGTIVRSVLASLPSQALTVHNELPHELPMVRASDRQMRRIVEHLVLTACANSTTPEIWLSATVDGPQVLLKFEDNGPSLWSEVRGGAEMGSLAEGQRGTDSGIGFALIRESLHQWGGNASIAARTGGGATTVLHLQTRVGAISPSAPDPAARAPES